MEEKQSLLGRIDLTTWINVGFMTVEGSTGVKKLCVVIPIEDNDIYAPWDEATGKYKAAHLGVLANERQTVGEYGETFFMRPSVSNKYAEKHPEEAEKLRKAYCGYFKPNPFRGAPQTETVAVKGGDDMPF